MIHHTDGIAHRSALKSNGIAPGFAVAKAEFRLVIGLVAAVKPHGAFPAANLAELRALVLQRGIERGLVDRAPGRQEPVREGNGVLQIVEFDDALAGVLFIGPITKAARIPGRQIPLSLAFGHPFGDGFAHRC